MTTIYGNALVSNNSGASTLPLITREPGVAVPYLCLLVVVIILGTLGNCTILFVGAVNGWKGVAKVGYEFIVNQALADLLVSAIANPFCIVGKWTCNFIYLHLFLSYSTKTYDGAGANGRKKIPLFLWKTTEFFSTAFQKIFFLIKFKFNFSFLEK